MKNENREKEREQEMSESRKLAAKGRRAESFLKSDFWLLDLEPVLAKIQDEAIASKGFQPGTGKTLDEVALSSAYFSAIDHTVGNIPLRIRRMISQGLEAEQYITKSEEGAK